MSRERAPRLNTSLWRAFLLQIGLISATAVAGVYLAEFAIRELLIVSALEREADYFWARRHITNDTPAPNTNSLIGYVFHSDTPDIPEEFANLGLGIHDLVTPVGEAVVHVSEAEGSRLYLLFDANNVKELATYFGIAPLALMLVVLYSSAWVAYSLTRRAVSPVIRLSRTVRELDLEKPDPQALTRDFEQGSVDAEIAALAHALEHLMVRVDDSIERERTFTREASHELRSPLTVIRMASDNLLKRAQVDDTTRALVEKINRAAIDMEELTEILLTLAREYEGALAKSLVSINQIVNAELSNCRTIYAEKTLEIKCVETAELTIETSPRVVAIVFGNLLRNACAYTEEGTVVVTIGHDRVTINDDGMGMTSEHLGGMLSRRFSPQHAQGNGIGLNLVKRITDRFGWEIEFDSEPERGTRVEVRFGYADAAGDSAPRSDNKLRLVG